MLLSLADPPEDQLKWEGQLHKPGQLVYKKILGVRVSNSRKTRITPFSLNYTQLVSSDHSPLGQLLVSV